MGLGRVQLNAKIGIDLEALDCLLRSERTRFIPSRTARKDEPDNKGEKDSLAGVLGNHGLVSGVVAIGVAFAGIGKAPAVFYHGGLVLINRTRMLLGERVDAASTL